MALVTYVEQDPTLKELFHTEALLQKLAVTIQDFLPTTLTGQFNIVCINEQQLIIYTKNNLVANYLNLYKNKILNTLNELKQLHEPLLAIKVKVRIANPTNNPPKIRKNKFNKTQLHTLENIAQSTSDQSLKHLMETLIKNNNSTQ